MFFALKSDRNVFAVYKFYMEILEIVNANQKFTLVVTLLLQSL